MPDEITFTDGQMSTIARTVKPLLEDAANRIGNLLAHNRYVGPLKEKLDQDFRETIISPALKLTGGYLNLPRGWFKNASQWQLSNEIVDSLFTGIADGLKEKWEADEIDELSTDFLREKWNARFRLVNEEVVVTPSCYHHPDCPEAPRAKKQGKKQGGGTVKPKMADRVTATLLGLAPGACCARYFRYVDDQVLEAERDLYSALEELDDAMADAFLIWATSLSTKKYQQVERHLGAIKHGDQIVRLMRVEEKKRVAVCKMILPAEEAKSKFMSRDHLSGLLGKAKDSLSMSKEDFVAAADDFDKAMNRQVSRPIARAGKRARDRVDDAKREAEERDRRPKGLIGLLVRIGDEVTAR